MLGCYPLALCECPILDKPNNHPAQEGCLEPATYVHVVSIEVFAHEVPLQASDEPPFRGLLL
eukprot:4835027-Prorocentrum_lima.AAC.1